MILIVTEADDPHADHVEEKIRRRGAEVVRFDPSQFPSRAAVSVSYSAAGDARARLSMGNGAVDLNRVRSVWYRRPTPSVPHDEIADPLTRSYVAHECQAFLDDVWHSMDCLPEPHCLWVPAPHLVIRRAELKALQLKVASSLGFELPPTLVTNSPDDFLSFYREHNGDIVSKLPSASLYKLTGTTFNRYTQVVSKRDVAYARSVRLCPTIFQAYVPKRVELRITVVGRTVLAAEIHSQQSNHTRHDWRRYDRYQTPYAVHELPTDVRQRCVSLVEHLGLCYGAIDMVLTPDDRYVFLEINPNGQYLWIEQLTGLPIGDAICDLLIAGTSARRSVPPSRQLIGCND